LQRYEPFVVAGALIALACHSTRGALQAVPTQSASEVPLHAFAPVPKAFTEQPEAGALQPSKGALAESVREQEWGPGSDPKIFPIESPSARRYLLVADFDEAIVPADGIPRGFRRFALFDDARHLLAKETIRKSSGGADLLETERRDVDGDGQWDLVLYYRREDQISPAAFGWIAVTAQGQLISAPLSLVDGDGHAFFANPCWLTVDHTPMLFTVWQESRRDHAGDQSVIGYRATAFTVEAGAAKSVALFGVIFATGNDAEALQARVPAEHRALSSDSGWQPQNCSAVPPAFVLAPLPGKRWALVTGLSRAKAQAGDDWPVDLAKPEHPRIMQIQKLEPSTWLTHPDHN
jgi:hypothetical protein